MRWREQQPQYNAGDTTAVIYFVQDALGYVKIGYSSGLRRFERRLSSLQVAHSLPLFLLAAIHGTKGQEAALHKKHQQDHIGGEWFRPTRGVLQSAMEHASFVDGQPVRPCSCGSWSDWWALVQLAAVPVNT